MPSSSGVVLVSCAASPTFTDQTRPDWWQHHQIDEVGIELGASPVEEHLETRIGSASAPISSTMRDGVKRIGDRDDT